MENLKNIVGKFYAISFEQELIEFIVYDDNSIDCPSKNVFGAYYMHLKPRFVLYYPGGLYFHGEICENGFYSKNDSIKTYKIDSRVLDYMKDKEMICYSQDMAVWYGLPEDTSFDRELSKKRFSYKRAIKMGPVLAKQRRGQF